MTYFKTSQASFPAIAHDLFVRNELDEEKKEECIKLYTMEKEKQIFTEFRFIYNYSPMENNGFAKGIFFYLAQISFNNISKTKKLPSISKGQSFCFSLVFFAVSKSSSFRDILKLLVVCDEQGL